MDERSLPDFQKLVTEFYNKNRKSLEYYYPGISAFILIREFNSYQKDFSDQAIRAIFDQLVLGIPLGHIWGRSYFYQSEFIVSPDVLIPRSETEILVEKAILEIKKKQKQHMGPLRVLDLGTGSGAIILSIMQECSELDCFATDISYKAIEIAKKNYILLRDSLKSVSDLKFILSDRFSNFKEGKLDLIVTNPPYIKRIADHTGVHESVDRYEPDLALYLPDEYYDNWFSQLFEESIQFLNPGGFFIMEGHEDHLGHLKILAEKVGFVNVAVIDDYTRRHRFLSAYK